MQFSVYMLPGPQHNTEVALHIEQAGTAACTPTFGVEIEGEHI